MSTANLSNNMADDIVNIAKESLTNVKSYLQYAAHSADRYSLTVYISGLVVPLASIIIKGSTSQGPMNEAATIWKEAIELLEEVLTCFETVQLLRRIRDIVDTVNSFLQLRHARNVLGPNNQSTISWGTSHDEPRNVDRHQLHDSRITGQAQSIIECCDFQFPSAHFHGLASDPDLWRVATW